MHPKGLSPCLPVSLVTQVIRTASKANLHARAVTVRHWIQWLAEAMLSHEPRHVPKPLLNPTLSLPLPIQAWLS